MKNIILAINLMAIPFLPLSSAHALECDEFDSTVYAHCTDYSDQYGQSLTTNYMMQWQVGYPNGTTGPAIESCISDLSSIMFNMKNPEGQYTIQFKMGYRDSNGNVSYSDYAKDTFYHSGVGLASPERKTIHINTASYPAVCSSMDVNTQESRVISIDDVSVQVTE